MWRNWAGDERCDPAAVERPASVGDIVAALERAAQADQPVRVAGAGHSFGDVVLTRGRLLVLDGMRGVVDVDRGTRRVRVRAGTRLRQLSVELAQHDLALENLGDIDVQTVAGALATGTHGTGGRLPNLSAQVEELELVTGTGDVVRCSAREDPDLLRAARVSIGSLGVVTEVTLRCVPAFNLRGVDAPRPLDETLDALPQLVEENDHFELFTFPHTGVALTRTNNCTDDPARPPGRVRSWLEDVALENGVLALLCRAGRRAPGRIPQVNRLVTRLATGRTRVDASHRIFASPRLVHFTEMEYAVPRAQAATAVRRVLDLIEERRFEVNFPIELRFVAADDALLSPAHERDSAYVAVHMYRGMAWEPYFRAVEAAMDELGGRPHWGKRHFQTAETLGARYPRWEDFQAVRARVDPDGRFVNEWARRVLGPVGVAAERQH